MSDKVSMLPRFQLTWKSMTGFLVRYREYLALGVIVILAFGIRYVGLKFSYPLLTHPDETFVLTPVLQMTANRTLDAGIPYRPNLVLITINYLILNVASFAKFGESIATTYAGNELFFTYSSRVLTAIIGASVPVAAWIISRQGRLKFALPAALFTAFFPSYVVHSHYITPDVPLTFLTLLVMLLAINYAQSGNRKILVLATFAAALNTIEKYPGLISFSLIILSILYFEWCKRTRFDREFFLSALKQTLVQSGLLLFFMYLIAPNLFIQFGRTYDAILNEARPTHLGADNLGWVGNLAFYAVEYFKAGNWLLILLIIPGLIYGIRRREPGLLFMLYGILYWVLLSVLSLHWERWALPMYTAPLLLAAYGAAAIGEVPWIKPRLRSLAKTAVVAVVGLALFISAFSNSVRLTYLDTRVQSLDYCRANGITEDNTLFEGYSPLSPAMGPGSITPERYQAASNVEFIILSSNMYSRHYAEPDRYADQIAIYERIRAEQQLIAEFSQQDELPLSFLEEIEAVVTYVRRFLGEDLPLRLTGPTIQIYRVVKPLF